MISADKIKIIQDLQCKYSAWLSKLNSSLSLAQCPEKYLSTNYQVSNLIEVLYSYKPFDEEVTNADIITIEVLDTNAEEIYDITIDYGAVNLATFNGTGTQESILSDLRTLINSGTETHGYICLINENSLYLYTYSGTATFSDVPTITYSELDLWTTELTMTLSELDSDSLSVILDTWNCLTLDEVCDIINKVKSLLQTFNCN